MSTRLRARRSNKKRVSFCSFYSLAQTVILDISVVAVGVSTCPFSDDGAPSSLACALCALDGQVELLHLMEKGTSAVYLEALVAF
mgnify:CR=1 FL=1